MNIYEEDKSNLLFVQFKDPLNDHFNEKVQLLIRNTFQDHLTPKDNSVSILPEALPTQYHV